MAIFKSRNSRDLAGLPAGHDDRKATTYIPDELRADYLAAADPSVAILMPYMQTAKERRADQAEARWQAEYNRKAKGSGAGPATPGVPRRADVLKAGHIEEDEATAEHLYRLACAKGVASVRAAELAKHTKRMAAQCQSCEALDVPTQPVVIELIPSARSRGDVVTVPGGRVCQPCEVAIRTEYIARQSRALAGDGRTRAEVAAAFLDNGR